MNFSSEEVYLISLWDMLSSNKSGMSTFFNGLQGDKTNLVFKQLILNSRRGMNLPLTLMPFMKFTTEVTNKNIFDQIIGKDWVIGGQQFVHLFQRDKLGSAIGIIFDLLDLDNPDFGVTEFSFGLSKNRLNEIKYLKRIITISHHSKQRILSHLEVDPTKIVTIYPGIDHKKFKVQEKMRVRKELNIPDDSIVLLYVGSEHRRKNLITLIRGLSMLEKNNIQTMFIKIGKSQSTIGRKKLISTLQKEEYSKNTRILEDISEKELINWYSAADIFTFPSVGEGFGIPILEAMACGLPVITTQCASIPEVIDDAGISVQDPYSSDEWYTRIKELIFDSGKRSELSALGQNRALKFSWDDSRSKFISLLSD